MVDNPIFNNADDLYLSSDVKPPVTQVLFDIELH
ncbi:hypothetical protein NIES3275_25550 [Microchaete diplosiphon NIES-3275]|nr:hypothetical protein NIES3275_25550 [Microchaete diplosiphon NIES-3275]